MCVESSKKLIFVYNADTGFRNSLLDGVHKVISPNTYNCNLCNVTYGVFTEKSIWKDFRQNTPIEMEFLHKDEFKTIYNSNNGHDFEFPIVLVAVKGKFEAFINKGELDELKKPEDLIEIIQRRI